MCRWIYAAKFRQRITRSTEWMPLYHQGVSSEGSGMYWSAVHTGVLVLLSIREPNP